MRAMIQPSIVDRPNRRAKPSQVAGMMAALLLSGCASFSTDAGMATVAGITGATINKDVLAIRSTEDAQHASDRVRGLLARPLNVEAAVQMALLNNRGLQAAYNELALAETDMVQEGLPPNPRFSISS